MSKERPTLFDEVIGTGAELAGLYLVVRSAFMAFTSGISEAVLPFIGGAFLLRIGSDMKHAQA